LGILGKAEILAWRARVGEAEANKISSRAARRGTAIHSLCEDYLLNKEVNPGPFDLETFGSIRPYLDNINNIHCLETQLYSDYLQVAGTVDCIAEYEGKLSIIDFKTSKRIKTRDDIHGYFMQTSAYAVMFEERTGIPVGRLVIIMSVDDENTLVFKEKRDDWINNFIELRADYSKLHNT
jgi:genome maintenance exonuclease 1